MRTYVFSLRATRAVILSLIMSATFGRATDSFSDLSMAFYFPRSLDIVAIVSGKRLVSVPLPIADFPPGRVSLAYGGDGIMLISGTKDGRPAIFTLLISGAGNGGAEFWMVGAFPVKDGQSLLYFYPLEEGFELRKVEKIDLRHPVAGRVVHSGPFFPEWVVHGAGCFAFFDAGKELNYLYTKEEGVTAMPGLKEFVVVGVCGADEFICGRRGEDGVFFVRRNGELIRRERFFDETEMPLSYSSEHGVLVVNTVRGTGFLWLGEANETWVVRLGDREKVRVFSEGVIGNPVVFEHKP